MKSIIETVLNMEGGRKNPWAINSIYDFYNQKFNCFACPMCEFGLRSKQFFINHAFEYHPESTEHLYNISDGSIDDVKVPSNVQDDSKNIAFKKDYQCSVVLNKSEVENLNVNTETTTKKEINDLQENFSKRNKIKKIVYLKECEVCGVKRQTFDGIKGHMSNVHGLVKLTSNEIESCEKCDKEFGFNDLFKHLIQVHKTGVLFQCDKCPKEFLRPEKFDLHIDTHVIPKSLLTHFCTLCTKSYQQKNQLVYHLAAKHNQGKLFACPKCKAYFIKKDWLDTHMMKCLNERFICSTPGCQKEFNRLRCLKEHEETHQEPIPCSMCDGKFSCKRNLKKHFNRIHLDVRPISCEYCDARLKDHSCYDWHREHTHKDIKDEKCDICEEAFAGKRLVRKHKKEAH